MDPRKATPIFSGVLRYFPLALAAVARLSKTGNDKHNPGEPLHWAREKSNDHGDCIVRHQIEFDQIDAETGEYHAVAVAWRALAQLELLEEARIHGPVEPHETPYLAKLRASGICTIAAHPRHHGATCNGTPRPIAEGYFCYNWPYDPYPKADDMRSRSCKGTPNVKP